MDAILDQLVADFQERQLPELTPRSAELPLVPGKVDAIIGMRRVGKTYFLYQNIRALEVSGVSRERILYLNFEDERLLPMSAADLGRIPEALYRRFPASRDRRCWFFLDEVQNVPSWERFVRRLIDTEDVAVVVTGSSAKLLGREIATSLRGRSLTTEILPFSFEETLRHLGVELPKRWPPPARRRSLLENLFDRYLEVGGFPEIQSLTPELRLRVLQDYVDVVLFRDVVERHGVENLAALRYLQRALLARPANKFSIHKLYNDLRSQGIRAGKDTLHSFLAYFEDAFLVFTTTVASPSARVRQTNPRKCYVIDHALAAATSFRVSRDVGHRLENLVHAELRRRGYALSYVNTPSGYEVDFLGERLGGERVLIQVCADMSDDATRRRELRALEEGMAAYDVDRATLVTLLAEETVELESGTITVVPAWRWLLEPRENNPLTLPAAGSTAGGGRRRAGPTRP